MQELRTSDLRRILRFVALAEGLAGGATEPFPPPLLAGLRELIPADSVSFCELDRVRKLDLGATSVGEDGMEGAPIDVYWRLRHEHPVCAYQDVTHDFLAYRLSDFASRRELRRREIHAHWFVPWECEHELVVGLDAPLSHTKVFIFSRSSGPDFSERDRAVLDELRPFLATLYRAADARRVANAALASVRRSRARADTASTERPLLLEEELRLPRVTAREREILELVAGGMTNGEVARALSLSPATVRTHLRNAFATLGVHTRTAAVARLRDARVASAYADAPE